MFPDFFPWCLIHCFKSYVSGPLSQTLHLLYVRYCAFRIPSFCYLLLKKQFQFQFSKGLLSLSFIRLGSLLKIMSQMLHLLLFIVAITYCISVSQNTFIYYTNPIQTPLQTTFPSKPLLSFLNHHSPSSEPRSLTDSLDSALSADLSRLTSDTSPQHPRSSCGCSGGSNDGLLLAALAAATFFLYQAITMARRRRRKRRRAFDPASDQLFGEEGAEEEGEWAQWAIGDVVWGGKVFSRSIRDL